MDGWLTCFRLKCTASLLYGYQNLSEGAFCCLCTLRTYGHEHPVALTMKASATALILCNVFFYLVPKGQKCQKVTELQYVVVWLNKRARYSHQTGETKALFLTKKLKCLSTQTSTKQTSTSAECGVRMYGNPGHPPRIRIWIWIRRRSQPI